MTKSEKEKILKLRDEGMSLSQIATTLNLPVGTIKTYCHRNNIGKSKPGYCKNCGEKIEILKHHRLREYCSDKCRSEWWRKHNKSSQTVYHPICANCGSIFESRGNKNQKYCSHACYITARFGKEAHHDE